MTHYRRIGFHSRVPRIQIPPCKLHQATQAVRAMSHRAVYLVTIRDLSQERARLSQHWLSLGPSARPIRRSHSMRADYPISTHLKGGAGRALLIPVVPSQIRNRKADDNLPTALCPRYGKAPFSVSLHNLYHSRKK